MTTDPRLLPDPEPAYRVVSVRLPDELLHELSRRADEVDRSLSWYIRNALQVTVEGLNRAYDDGAVPEGPLAEKWAISKQAGTGGHTYEIQTTFLLPYVGEADNDAYDVRDAVVHQIYLSGARDVVARLLSLGGLGMDTRARTSTDAPILAESVTMSDRHYPPGGATS